MDMRIAYLRAVMGTAAEPNKQDLAREQLADIMPAVAVTVEALNHAHRIGRTEEWTQELSGKYNASRIAADSSLTVPRGLYSATFHFEPEADGFVVTGVPQDGLVEIREPVFSVMANAKGAFNFMTQTLSYHTPRKEELWGTERVLGYFGEWVRRNFNHETRMKIDHWLPKVLDSKASIMPQPRTDWVNRFAVAPAARRKGLTAA